MSDFAIRVENLGKEYRIGGTQERYKTLRDTLAGMALGPVRALQSLSSRGERAPSRDQSFWALKDVSFEVKPGEVVGVIGRNGAGKSTLLKVLSRITEPSEGQVRIRGRVGSLLEVGTGFHPELSGRENIFLNGAILGMSRSVIEKRFDEIVDFAEVERFIDTPVKRYSSGMYLKLAFAVAAYLEPEILVVDEVLAVGDAQFQKKCLGKMQDVATQGRTVLFVSHNMSAVRSLCSRAMVMEKGSVKTHGSVDECLQSYMFEKQNHGQWKRDYAVTSGLSLEALSLRLSKSQPHHQLNVDLSFMTSKAHKPAFIALDIQDSAGGTIMQALPTPEPFIHDTQPHHSLVLTIDLPPLIPGHYAVTVWVGSHNTETLDEVKNCASFEVTDSPSKLRTFPHTSDHGFIVPLSTCHYAGQDPSGGTSNGFQTAR